MVEASFREITIPAVRAYELRWRNLIKAPIDVCWKYWHEPHDKWSLKTPPQIKSSTELLREPEMAIYDIIHEIGGKRLRTIERESIPQWKEVERKHIMFESEYIDGDGKGNRYTMSLESVPEGTVLETVGVYLLKDDKEAALWLDQGRRYVENDTINCEEIARSKSK